MIKRIIIKESTYNKLITENRASKNQSLARKVVRSIRPDLNDNDITNRILHDIPNVRLSDFHLFPAVTRMVLNNMDSLSAEVIQQLNEYLLVVAPKAKEQGFNQDLNGMSLQEFFDTFKGDVENTIKDERSKSSSFGQGDGNYNGYNIVPIKTYEYAKEYNKYTDWCVTSMPDAFSRYAGNGLFYFLLKKGFENVEKKVGENAPLDEYGLSMIAVSFNEKGDVKTITCRWNHDNGGNDNVMSPEQVSKVIGADIYSIFNPEDNKVIKPKNLDIIVNKENSGFYLCRYEGRLMVCNLKYSNMTFFDNNPYVKFETSVRGNNKQYIIKNDGSIIAWNNGELNILEVYDLLVVICQKIKGGGLYDSKTLEQKISGDIRMANYDDEYIYLTDYYERQQLYHMDLDKPVFDKWVNVFTPFEHPLYDDCFLCFLNNKVSIQSASGGKILDWNRVLGRDKDNGVTFIEHDNGKVLIISDEDGILLNGSNNKMYYSEETPYCYLFVSGNDCIFTNKTFTSSYIDIDREGRVEIEHTIKRFNYQPIKTIN